MSEIQSRSFAIASCLGRGGFGEVYRATMSGSGGLDADVAIKVLRRDIDPDGQAVQRLRDEGKLLARLHHPTILKVHDLVILEGRVSLVTEFVDGDDLTECFIGSEPLSPRALLEVIGQIASALAAAWHTPLASGESLQLVHRDIKPSNIRVGRHGEVKLLDFGIARTDSVEREARTSTNMMVGSPPYMAPERYLDGIVRPGSDVFSLGAALYEGLVHERLHLDWPIPMLASLAIDREHYEEHVVGRLALVQEQVPIELSDLLCDMLAYVPEDRPTARDLAGRCERLADQMKGKSLARWCRDRVWNDAGVERGDLEGRTISEGSMHREMAPVEILAPVVPPPVAGQRGSWVGLGVLALLLMGLAFSVALVGGLGSAWTYGAFDLDRGSPAADPVPAAVPVSEEPEAPVADFPAQTPVPELVESSPPSGPPRRAPEQPAPAPPPSSPATIAPAPSPVEAPPILTARVDQSGDEIVVVELRGQGASYVLPADVPVGSYEVFAKYNGRDGLAAGALDVVEGGEHIVTCKARLFRCDIR
jgi:eukaryotic-like serine/threonine-protein kinase